jgi:hypothetical protein
MAGLISFAMASAEASSSTETDSIALENLSLEGVRAETVRHEGRDAIRLIEVDDKRRGGMALVKSVSLGDGVIEVDVAGRKGPYAAADDRGFIGIAFRVSSGPERYEYVYLRPENGRADDQVRRNHATQYASHPDFPWPRMRKEFPERYESYVDLEPGVWTRMRVEISGTTARLFVHGASQPTLVVNAPSSAPGRAASRFGSAPERKGSSRTFERALRGVRFSTPGNPVWTSSNPSRAIGSVRPPGIRADRRGTSSSRSPIG